MVTQKRKQKFDFVSDEERRKCIKEIIGFFQDERNEEIGIIAAERVLDFFLQTMGEEIYRRAIEDVMVLLKERFEDLDVELATLVDKRL
ncbi:MAG: DUF2164 family protein [Nanoarchaeota archaeon]